MAALGFIKTLTIHPGHFRTDVTQPEKHAEFLTKKSENYQPMTDFMAGFAARLHGSQPGDVTKAVEFTLDLVRGEGLAEGRAVPADMWMGSDAYTDVKAHCENTLGLLAEWEEAIKSTDLVV